MILEFTTVQLLQTIINPLGLFLFLILGLVKLKHAKTGNIYNIYLSLFFILNFLGFLINITYFLLSESLSDTVYIVLSRLAFGIILYSSCFPLFFQINLKKGFVSITKKDKIIYFGGIGLLVLLLLIFGQINLGEERKIYWGLYLGALSIGIVSAEILYFMYLGLGLLKKFQDNQLKKKYIAFLAGYVLICIIYIFISLMNIQVISLEFYSVISAISIIPSSLLIYYGIGRKMGTN